MSGQSDSSDQCARFDRKVFVYGLPEGTTESSVQIHFGKKRNGGGDIENVTCLPGGRAIVVFEDVRVAEEVVKREQIFKGKVLEVKIVKIAKKPSVEELRSEESAEKKQTRTVQISGLPEGTTESSVQIHFGKKRNGGGDIENVTCLTGGRAIVVFEDVRVAEEVVKTKQTFNGKVLEVKIMKIEAKPNVEELRSEESAEKKQTRTIQISGLPEGTTESSVQIHFGKKRNGGGDIESVTCLAGGKATVVFEDLQVAEEVVKTKQIFKGKVLEVKVTKIEAKPIVEELRNEESAEKKQTKTVQVFGLPEGTTESSVQIHFGKKRNGGGDIENVTCLTGGKAIVVFEDPTVAEEVVKTKQVFKGKVLEMKIIKIEAKPSVEKLRSEESVKKKQTRTVQVSGLPEGTTENDVHIHFGKKRNCGGDIEKVTLTEGRAIVVFEDPRVAEEVVKTRQTFKGKVLEVKIMKIAEKPIVEELKSEKSAEKKLARTVQVFGLPEGTTENDVHIHFQKKRNGGGDIENVTLTEGRAIVVFEDPRVAKTVFNTKQIFEGNVLEVKRLDTKTKPNEELKKQEKGGKNQTRVVKVSGLPEGTTENSVHIHFQKKRNGGGEVEKVKLLPEGKAVVVFEDPEVAQKVVKKVQKFQGIVVDAKLDESGALGEEESSGRPEISKPEGCTVLVSGLPKGATENGVHIHFQKRKNGGGEVIKVILFPERNEALVTFEDIEVAKTAVTTPQEMNGKSLTVNFLKSSPETKTAPEVTLPALDTPETDRSPEAETKPEETRPGAGEDRAIAAEIDQVFGLVTAEINPILMNTASQQFWSNFIQNTCGKECQTSVNGNLLSGTLSQVTKAGKLIASERKKRFQDPQCHEVPDQGSTTNQATLSQQILNQSGTTNPIGSLIGGECPNVQAFDGKPENEYHQNPNYSLHHRNQQSGRNGEGHESKRDKNFTNQFDDSANYNPAHYNVKHAKPPGLTKNISNPRQFETQLNTHSDYIAGSPNSTFIERGQASGGMMDPLGVEALRSIDSTRDLQTSGDGQMTIDTTTGTENQTPKVAGTSSPHKPDVNGKPSSLLSSTRNRQTSGNGQMTTSTDTTTGAENPTVPEVVDTLRYSHDKPDPPKDTLLPSPNSTTNHQPDNQSSTFTNPTTGPGNSNISSNLSGSLSNDKMDLPSGKPPTSSNSTTTHQPDNPAISNPETGPANVTTSNNQSRSLSNDKGDLPDEKPITTTTQPPANNNKDTPANSTKIPETLTTPNNQSRSLSNDKGDLPDEKPITTTTRPPVNNNKDTPANPTKEPENLTTPNPHEVPLIDRQDSLTQKQSSSPDSTTNRQSPVENQQGTIPKTTTGLQNSTKSSNPAEFAPSNKVNVLSEKPLSLTSEDTNNQSDNIHQQTVTDPSSGSENPTSSSSKTGSLPNDQLNSLVEKPTSVQDSITKPQPSDDDQGTTAHTTTETNSTTSNNQAGELSSNKPGSLSEEPCIPAEKTPSNQPEDHQPEDNQQTTPDQISNLKTPTPENLKKVNEVSPDRVSGAKPSEKVRTMTENNPKSKDKPQKRTPIPKPRQKKPNAIAANFSSASVKAKQGTRSPTEMNNHSVNDKPTAATKQDKEGDQSDKTQNSENLKTKDSETAAESGIHGNDPGDDADTISKIGSENTSHSTGQDNLDDLD